MHEDTVPTTVDTGRWLSLAEAAHALGISEKTASRRARAGQIEARQVSTRHGPAWQVRVPGTVDTGDRVDPTGTQAATMLELVRLVGDLQGKVEATALWQGRVEMLASQLADARETIRALEAPKPEPEPSPSPAPPYAASWSDRWQARVPVALVALAVLAMIGMALPAWAR